ncbi:hypothetical protein N8T08_002179 [Aspergillus melleus]|uniref:Uncharacterized protein n=1 Tax=Aspergillus melleus TaxID=138277 RepID=A0ACC3B907_9EURO|nr:hypothetical protein N8T08_002179 [Aspergillus melleus]
MKEFSQDSHPCTIDDSYHFFGDLWLEPPEQYLQCEALQHLEELEPLIKEFEQRQEPGTPIDLKEAFRSFTQREVAAWKRLGVERPSEFLLPPAGSSNAPIACHLYNPTFFTDNPYSQSMVENKNPTMVQLQQAGFSLQNTLFFDHVCRRDRTEDVLLFYSEDITRIHEDFMMLCRKTMAAKVEICWGVPVRERMKNLLALESVTLWGKYRDVEIFIERDVDKIKRFLVFVPHPQYFFYHSHHTDPGSKFRRSKGRRQDLYLDVASRLGRVTVKANFYEIHHRPATYGHLRAKERQLVRTLESDAEKQLKKAFPDRFKEIEASSLLSAEKRRVEAANQSDKLIISKMINGDHAGEVARRRISVIEQATQSWFEAVRESFGGNYSMILLKSRASDWDDLTQWEEIPVPLVGWVHQQDGLKIDKNPISSTDDLIEAYHLLWNKSDLSSLTLLQTLFEVAKAYLSIIQKQKRASVQELYIPGVAPYHIMPRKCSNCGQRVLDDAFACYAKADPKIYFNIYRKEGCGLPGYPPIR